MRSARNERERDEGFESIRGSWNHLRGRMRVFIDIFSFCFPFAVIFLFSTILSLQSKGLVTNLSLHYSSLTFSLGVIWLHMVSNYVYFLILILKIHPGLWKSAVKQMSWFVFKGHVFVCTRLVDFPLSYSSTNITVLLQPCFYQKLACGYSVGFLAEQFLYQLLRLIHLEPSILSYTQSYPHPNFYSHNNKLTWLTLGFCQQNVWLNL